MNFPFRKAINKNDKLLIVPLFSDLEFGKSCPAELTVLLARRQQLKDFSAKSGETLLLFPDSQNLPKKILLAGFGKKSKLSAGGVRNNAALAAKSAKKNAVPEISFYLNRELNKYAQALAEGLILANYSMAKYQTGKNLEKSNKELFTKIDFISADDSTRLKNELAKGFYIGEAVNKVRDLVNGPANLINTGSLSQIAKTIAKNYGCKIKVLDEKELQKLGMGALLGVNRGSEIPAKLVVIEYKPGIFSREQPIVLAGKGVCFDSGGYNLKPSAHIKDMKQDMAGASAVLGLFMLLKRFKIKKRVIAVLPLTDNLIGSMAQKTNDIVTSYSGKTIEVLNTDAEGRLILADAISYAVEKFNPKYVIDIATLTGAITIALGDRYAGLFGNDRELLKKLQESGEETDELLWPMPIHRDHRAKLKSPIADIQNCDESGLAGASKGAAFIQEFVGKTKWAHLDIAGVAYVKDPKKYDYAGATGYGVRLLLNFLEK
jgi:leucyl aminopeptidase